MLVAGTVHRPDGVVLGRQFELSENSMQRARWIKSGQVGLLASVGAMLALVGPAPTNLRAADKAQGDVVEPENKLFQTSDGGTLHGTYYKSPGDLESPVVVLLHMKDGNRFVWQGDKGFARRLQQAGYAVIAGDGRFGREGGGGGAGGGGNAREGGGGSGKKKDKKKSGIDLRLVDLEAMVAADMEAVKNFIKDEHQAKNLNM